MRFHAHCIPHSVSVIVLALAFFTKDLNDVGDAIKIFLFPDLSPYAGSEAALLNHCWDAVLRDNTLTSFSDTRNLPGMQNVILITRRNAA